MSQLKEEKDEVQPWDDLEFGVNVLDTNEPASKPGFHQPSHVEHAQDQKGESFWDALRAENETDSRPSDAHSHARLRQLNTEERKWSVGGLDLPRINTQALAATQYEHNMSFLDGLRMYPKAILWSAGISLAIVGEGFDTALVNSLFAFDTFKESYGHLAPDGTYIISPAWQVALSNGATVGALIGLVANGWLTERYGFRRSLMGALVSLIAFIFLTFFAFNIGTLLAGQVLCGIPWGICSTLTISYAAEVMPLALRGYLSSNINLCWIIGQIIAQGTLRGLVDTTSQWSYRIPFAIQWFWAGLVLVIVFFAPESPWFLVRKGRLEQARAVLVRLAEKNQNFNPDNVIAMMQHTDLVEKQLNNGKKERNDVTFIECFRGKNLRRTEIASCIFVTQNLCGLPAIGFAAYYYSALGFGIKRIFDLTLAMYGLAIVASMLSLVLLKFFGRRTIYLCGLVACATVLLCSSIIGTLTQNTGTLWGQAGTLILFIFVFDITIGPSTYTLVSELPSTRLRVHTIVIARICYNLSTILTNTLTAYALNPTAWNLGGQTNWIWFGTCSLCLVYCYWRLPETKGLTYHELDILFEKGASARKFAAIQKKLDESGYFGFYDDNPDAEVAWT